MEDFVPYELAVKLKEKRFTIPTKSIFGMYNEIGVFHTLTTSADYETCDSGFKCRCYYNYDDFDSRDFIAPTISQVLKWLREEKKIYVEPCILADADTDADCKVINEYTFWSFSVTHIEIGDMIYFEYERIDDKRFDSYELAALAGIEYVIDNII